MENQVFNIDAQVAAYRPVQIRFRGQDYVLGDNILQVIAAAELTPGEDGKVDTASIVKQLPAYLRTLCPAIAPALEEPLKPAEEVALLRPITVVMNQLSAAMKSEEEGGE